jgi:hypothetical protein
MLHRFENLNGFTFFRDIVGSLPVLLSMQALQIEKINKHSYGGGHEFVYAITGRASRRVLASLVPLGLSIGKWC